MGHHYQDELIKRSYEERGEPVPEHLQHLDDDPVIECPTLQVQREQERKAREGE